MNPNYQKWETEYIKNIDLTKIKWIKLNGEDLIKYIDLNYLDKKTWSYVLNEKVSSVFASPLGLKYLNINMENSNYNFLLGVVQNNIGKNTIVADICYINDYYYLITKKKL